MALSANTPRTFEQGDRNEYPVLTAVKIYEGAAVGLQVSSGYARPLVAGDVFAGFAEDKYDNTSGASGAINCRVKDEGKAILAIASAAITDIGKAVYASDDGTFTFTQGSNSYVGRVVRWISTGNVVVAFAKETGGVLTALTAATGTPGDTIADVTGTFSQSVLNNNFKSIADKLNFLLAAAK